MPQVRVPGFVPSEDGLHFANCYPHEPQVVVDFLGHRLEFGDAANGLCGGMVYAVPAALAAKLVYPQRACVAVCGDGGFAIIDSDHLGRGNTEDTSLVTPTLDLSAAPGAMIRFNSDWRALGSSDFADVDVSTDGGATWTNLWHQTASRRTFRSSSPHATPAPPCPSNSRH